MDTNDVRRYLSGLQERIVEELSRIDGKTFRRDAWARAEGGGGESRILEEGNLFERAGVNLSHVCGKGLPPSASATRPGLAGRGFEAMGVSLVLHPRNPYCPTAHMNVRFFVAYPAHANNSSGKESRSADDPENKAAGPGEPGMDNTPEASKPVWWFGGGMDLTPYYGFEEDCVHFHSTCKQALDPFGPEYYPRFKRWCDQYFHLKHRGEPRGIGGIFFDDFAGPDFDSCFDLVRSTGDHFLSAYVPIVERRRHMEFGERERDFQAYRRGRYVEFNLVYDRGTLFGLQSAGRTESILMSLPPIVRWRYDWSPEPGTAEDRLYKEFLRPRDWI